MKLCKIQNAKFYWGVGMDSFLYDLFSWTEDRCGSELAGSAEYRACAERLERHCARVRSAMGEDFCGGLEDCVYESARLEQLAAFAWGLRLGLDLHTL